MTRPGILCCLRVPYTNIKNGNQVGTKAIPTAATNWTGLNYGGYMNPQADAIIDRLAVTIDPRERLPLAKQHAQVYTSRRGAAAAVVGIFPVLIREGIKGPRDNFLLATNISSGTASSQVSHVSLTQSRIENGGRNHAELAVLVVQGKAGLHRRADALRVEVSPGVPAFLGIPERGTGLLPAMIMGHERYGLVLDTLDQVAKMAAYGFPPCASRRTWLRSSRVTKRR